MRSLVGGVALAAAACQAPGAHDTLAALRPACGEPRYWDGHACQPRGDAADKVEEGRRALAKLDLDAARAALTAAEAGGPLRHDTHVALWEQRGIAAAYVNDTQGASAAFDMMIALDPGHFLSYTLSPKATFVFEKARGERQAGGLPALDVSWPHEPRVGDAVPIELSVRADPKQFLRRATLFVRARGDASWRAADVELAAHGDRRLSLPPVTADKPVALQLYLRAYDARGNEVLTWADPAQPRELPLRYDPPVPWYRRTWVIVTGLAVVGLAAGATVYELTQTPPDRITGGVTVR